MNLKYYLSSPHNMLIVFFIILIAIVLIFPASAAIVGKFETNGTEYVETWDGRRIPSTQIIQGSNDDGILETDFLNAKTFSAHGDSITIPKANITFKRGRFSVSPVMTYSKAQLISKMININATVAYVVVPYNLARLKDFADNKTIKVGGWTFKAGNEHIKIYDENGTVLSPAFYDFRIVGDEIRLYFLKAESNKLNGSITFEPQTWYTNGSTTPAWNQTLLDNTTIQDNNSLVVGSFSDTYTRANSSNIGNNYINPTFASISNQILVLANTDDHLIWINNTNATKYISASLLMSTSYVYGFIFFSNTTSIQQTTKSYSGYIVEISPGGNTETLFHHFGTSKTQISQCTASAGIATYTLDVSTVGTGLKLYKGGNLICTFTLNNSYSSGYTGLYTTRTTADFDNLRIFNSTFGNSTFWSINAQPGNYVSAINISVPSNPPNTNLSVTIMDNSTGTPGAGTLLGSNLTVNAQNWINVSSGNVCQICDTNVTMYGNLTATIEISAFEAQFSAVSGGSPSFMPPVPTGCSVTTGNFWTNSSCGVGAGNITDSMNKTNGTLAFNTTAFFINRTLSPHATNNESFRAWNNSGVLNDTPAWANVTIPNNLPSLSVNNQTVTEGQNVLVQLNVTDADNDAQVYSINRTDLFTDFSSSTGKGNWTPNFTSAGTYYINAGINDGYGGIANFTFWIQVNDAGSPNITSWNSSKGNISQTILLNLSEVLNVSIVANQSLNPINWSKDGTEQYNNSLSANFSWDKSGRRSISVNGSNVNGSTQFINLTIEVRSNIINRHDTISDKYVFSQPSPPLTFYYGNLSYLITSTNQLIGTSAFILINFTNISGYSNISNASLYIYTNDKGNDGYKEVRRVTSAWNEDDDTNPSTTETGGFTAYFENGNSNINLTDFVKGWNNGSYPQHGIKIYTNCNGCGGFPNPDSDSLNISSRDNINMNASYIQINLTGAVNPVLNRPDIISWGSRNDTQDFNTTLTYTVSKNTNITFNITANQTVTTTWGGTAGATKINDTHAFKNFTSAGTYTVIASCNNANGTCTNGKTWTITVLSGTGYSLTVNVKNELGLNLQNAKVYINNTEQFTDGNGNVTVTGLDGSYALLVRAIQYSNSSSTVSLSGDAIQSVILYERTYATKDDTDNVSGIAISAAIISAALVLSRLRQRK